MPSIIRPGTLRDIPQLQQLAESFPLGNLPEDKNQLTEIIKKSLLSFSKNLPKDQCRFLFVLDFNGKLIGSSQILSYQANHPYFLLYDTKEKETVLQLSKDQKGKTQIGGLILHPQYRTHSEKFGRQIGLFRFLYMTEHPEAFTETIEVSLTAPLEENNSNPFWRFVNFPKLPKDYTKALKLYKINPPLFFSHLPKEKMIHLKNFPKTLKHSLHNVHPETLPVYKGLLKLGFKKTSRHHILDGGIFLEINRQNFPILRESKQVFLKQGQPTKKELYLWGKDTSEGFSGGSIKGELQGNIFLSNTVSPSLENFKVRVMPLYPYN